MRNPRPQPGVRAGRAGGRKRAGRAPVLFWLGAVLCAAAFACTYYVFVRTATGQFVDESALAAAGSVWRPARRLFLGFLNLIPNLSAALAAVVLLWVALARRRRHAAAAAVGVVAASAASSWLLKNLLPDRPDLGIPTLAHNSLPSGHTTLAAAAALAVFLVVSPRWRPFSAAAGGLYAVLTGAATLVNGWHRPSDVVAAFLVAGFWTLLAGPLVLRAGEGWNVFGGYGSSWASSRWWPRLCWLLSLLGAAAAAGIYWFIARTDPGAGALPLFFWAGAALITATGMLLGALLTWLFSLQSGRA
ncbi:phosphatase PAP2 family protein [Arthrobacter mobilis]|uniref:Phosphatase PAP2 family protein n=1 Tax=Arthrobacter mobilis TaxID=2724944 RepID=A0A7X6K5H9_9MICC|nr:phosphatase PAP2 family protein [Arthrobacter mobilis]NKX53468.1 phosphatase PAP2 family protein [Arthrobacter mobilis]